MGNRDLPIIAKLEKSLYAAFRSLGLMGITNI